MSKIALERIQKEQQAKTGNLDLTSLGLTAIPAEIKGMSWLTSLKLHDNKIKKIENLDTLIQLDLLSLHTNEITKIEGLKDLKSLEMLYLHGNKITKIEGLEGLKTITVLYLNANKISKIEGLSDLVNLGMLNLFNNEITTIEGLKDLKSLSFLYLHHNPICQISVIEQLTGLSVFSFGSQICTVTFEQDILNNIPVIYLNGRFENTDFLSTEILDKIPVFREGPRINLGESEETTDVNLLIGARKIHCKKGIYIRT